MPTTSNVTLRQESDYRFAIDFGAGIVTTHGDEPPPLGKGSGATPVQLLAAAVGNCLSASLLFALRKFKQSPDPIAAEVEAIVDRNERNRLRVQGLRVKLTLGVAASSLQHLDRVLAQFEDFCTVTQSVRSCIPVEVAVHDSSGQQLK